MLPLHVYVAATGDSKLENVIPSNSTLFGNGRVSKRSEGRVVIEVYHGNRVCNLNCELVK